MNKMNTAPPLIIRITSEETNANSYLVVEDSSVLLIDVSDADKITRLLEQHGWIPEETILTHEHVDHICGLNALRARYETLTVTASTACSLRIGDHKANLSAVYDLLAHSCTGIVCAQRHDPFTCKPCDTVFDDSLSLTWHGHSIFLQSCPGHSPGSTVLLFDDAFIFSGDYLLPTGDVNLSLPGSDHIQYETVTKPWIRQLLAVGMLIFPGHGEPYVYCAAETSPIIYSA